jgi:hypothetical protein
LLLFSPRTYWRLFQLTNEALWPLQIAVLLIGAGILTMLFRPRVRPTGPSRPLSPPPGSPYPSDFSGRIMPRSTGRRSISYPSSWGRRYLCSGSGPCAAGSPSLLNAASRG